jgi:hypothetical protein
MLKRFFNRLFHRSPEVSPTEARASIAILHQELAFIQELQTARLQGGDAITLFYAKYPAAFHEIMLELEADSELPKEMLDGIYQQVNYSIRALRTGKLEVVEL